VTAEKPGVPASLVAGTVLGFSARHDTLGPDNGGDSGPDY